MKSVLGIDPGLSGALALVATDLSKVDVIDTPVHAINGKQQMDVHTLARWMDVQSVDVDHAIIEQVGAMPGQGVTSCFNFGFGTGILHGVICASFIRLRLVRPAVWKRAMGLPADKDASRQMASRMFPKFAHLFSRKKDDGRAEAVLLAVYAMRNPA